MDIKQSTAFMRKLSIAVSYDGGNEIPNMMQQSNRVTSNMCDDVAEFIEFASKAANSRIEKMECKGDMKSKYCSVWRNHPCECEDFCKASGHNGR